MYDERAVCLRGKHLLFIIIHNKQREENNTFILHVNLLKQKRESEKEQKQRFLQSFKKSFFNTK